MDIQSIIKEYREKKITSDRFKDKLNYAIKMSPHFSSLNENNRKQVFEMIEKLKIRERIIEGRTLDSVTVREKMHDLFEKRVKLGLTEHDLEEIKEVIEMFR